MSENIVYTLGEATPKQKALNRAVNAHETLVSKMGGGPEVEASAAQLDQQLAEFEACNADGHSNPRWQIQCQRANVAAAKRRYTGSDGAIDHELLAVNEAQTDDERAKSSHNLSEFYRAAGDFVHSLRYAKQAYRLAPHNAGIHLNLTTALGMAGWMDEADRVAANYMRAFDDDATKPGSVLAAELAFNADLRRLAALLPSLQKIAMKP